jgi:cbb3-type cytochrome oxidase subunit 3
MVPGVQLTMYLVECLIASTLHAHWPGLYALQVAFTVPGVQLTIHLVGSPHPPQGGMLAGSELYAPRVSFMVPGVQLTMYLVECLIASTLHAHWPGRYALQAAFTVPGVQLTISLVGCPIPLKAVCSLGRSFMRPRCPLRCLGSS